MMKILVTISLLSVFLLTSCEKETDELKPSAGQVSARFHLKAVAYDGTERTRATETPPSTVRYDEISYYVRSEIDGHMVSDIKNQWRPETSELIIEGLQKGNYKLFVLAVQGDMKADRATIHPLTSIFDDWLSFPEDQTAPLQADYYYAKVDFYVDIQQGVETITPLQEVSLRRLIAGIEFSFDYNNPYVRTAVENTTLSLEDTKFYTTLKGSGEYGGESHGGVRKVSLDRDSRILRFMPSTRSSAPLQGKIEMYSRSYTKKEIIQYYNFSDKTLERGRLNHVKTQVVHPDDNSGVLFVNSTALDESHPSYILQDDEPKEVYTDANQRQFTVNTPLQTKITDDGKLHLRFYSPRFLKDAAVRILIPSLHEPVTLAYLDSIPAFADIRLEIPATKRSMTFPTASGTHVTLPPLTVALLQGGKITIESKDQFWTKLQKITIPWTIYFSLFGGNPDRPDGGPNGGWIGIRPVHCREAVAFMLNATYMFELKEVEQLMRDNADKLFGNDGVTPEPIDWVITKMHEPHTLSVGLVNPRIYFGLGSPSVWGVIQDSYLYHYDDPFHLRTNFHELGHVMGYNHYSQFTNGLWAGSLMNIFYRDHIREFPIDKYEYLNSRNNPNRYK